MMFYEACSGFAQSSWDQSGSMVPGWMGKDAVKEKGIKKFFFFHSRLSRTPICSVDVWSSD